jgi:hypothetical protein
MQGKSRGEKKKVFAGNIIIQWKLLIMITLGLALFDNNRLIILSGGYKNLHSLTQFIAIVQHFTCIKNNKIYLKNLCSVVYCLFAISSF